MYNYDKISSSIHPIDACTSFFLTNSFSLHQLMSYYLDKSGPASIRISSFSMCETAIRNFIRENEKGNIIDSKAILDFSLTKRSIDKLLFAGNVLKNIRLIENHSKLLLIFNSDITIAIIGSANFNDNRKLESGIIFINHPNFNNILKQFEEIYQISMPI